MRSCGVRIATRMTNFLAVLYALILSLLADFVIAGDQLALRPVFYVSSDDLFRFAVSFGYAASVGDKNDFFNPEINGPNFIFISQKNTLVDGAINTEYLKMFSPSDRNIIAKFNARSDECFIQPIKTSKIDYMLLVLNNSENGPIEGDERCYLTALAIFWNMDPAIIETFGEMTLRKVMDRIVSRRQ